MPVRLLEQLPVNKENSNGRDSHALGRPERRKRVRTRLRWQVALLAMSDAEMIESSTRDLSSKGFYCNSPVPFVPGARMVCILKVPAYHPEKVDAILSLECKVRIVRVEPSGDEGFYGLGCEIEDYRLLHI